MSVSREHIRHIASLARLRFSEEEEHAMSEDLSRMVAYVEQLQTLDTRDVPPMEHVLDLHSVLRDDVERSRISRDEVLDVAPVTDGAFFRVPKVIE